MAQSVLSCPKVSNLGEEDFFTAFKLLPEQLIDKGMCGDIILVQPLVRPDLKYIVKKFTLLDEQKKDRNYKCFQAEVKIMQSFDHPFLMSCMFAGQCTDYLAHCTCYYQKGTLDNYMGKISLELSEYCVTQIACALRYLHKNNVAHLDVKLDNIFLDSDFNAILGDFGLAAELTPDQKTLTKRQCYGTLGYFAPEWRRAPAEKELDPYKLDSYGLGIVLWAMVFQKEPSSKIHYDIETRKNTELSPRIRWLFATTGGPCSSHMTPRDPLSYISYLSKLRLLGECHQTLFLTTIAQHILDYRVAHLDMATAVYLQALDYAVIALIVLISLGIGVMFAVKDYRNANREEYLLGARRMSMLPVALSMFATSIAGVAYIGMTADVYSYGAMSVMILFGVVLGFVCAAFTLVPLLHPLRLTSLYEYLQMRFDSSVVRSMALAVGMLQTMCYMAVVLLAPALALQTGAGLPMWMSIGGVGFIGTVYTAIGGIKSVVWTDAFQSFIMLAGLLAIIFKGISAIGGEDSVWRLSRDGGRASFNSFSLDPRDRYTWWAGVVGGSIFGLGFLCNQAALQRISSMRSMKDARNAFLISAAIYTGQVCLLIAVGWVMYSYFASIRCDPIQAGIISSRNQLTVYFVVHALRDLPGIAGIFMASIFSGSLSTLSSGINALAANTTVDILKTPLRKVTESTATFITKVMVFLYGILIIGLSYAAYTLKGPIVPIVVVSTGVCGGPVLGVFLLGALVPWGNKYGAICGGLAAIVFNMWIAIGHQMYGRRWKTLPPAPTDMCYLNSSITEFTNASSLGVYLENTTLFTPTVNQSQILSSYMEGKDPYSYGFFLYDISYEWYGFIGALVSLVLGLIISYCSRRHCVPVTDERLLFPFVRKFWLGKSPGGNDKIDTGEGVEGLMLQGYELNGKNSIENTISTTFSDINDKRIEHCK